MSDSEVEDIDPSDIPDVDTCQKLCEQFASVTGTDTACAQFFLQGRQCKWDLNRAVVAYFDAKKSDDDVQVLNSSGRPEVVISFESFASAVAAATGSLQQQPLNKLKFITWNIDGLDDRSLTKRIKIVCNTINCELPDVVHLQEVVPTIYPMLSKYLAAYRCIPGNDPEESDYFTVTLIRNNSLSYESHSIEPFHSSLMGRNLLVVKAKIADVSLTLINTHLESTKEHADERIKQLKLAFQKVLSEKSDRTVFLGGDLNLRDTELQQVGGIPKDMEDMWLSCGKRPECEFTWDARRNSNINIPNASNIRCRFDRIYVRHAEAKRLKPVHFGLIGLEKIHSCGRFPSDHWGLVANFDV